MRYSSGQGGGHPPGLFKARLLRVDALEETGVELGPAVKGVQSVHFLLDIVELRVAESGNLRVEKEGFGQFLVAVQELLFAARPVPVAPGFVVFLTRIPPDSAVFADKVRLAFVDRMLILLAVHKDIRRREE